MSIELHPRFLRTPVNYPAYLEDPVVSFDEEGDKHQENIQLAIAASFQFCVWGKKYIQHP